MLKPILLGGAMLLAIPALAQTTGSGSAGSADQGSMGTTTNDHDPTQSGDQAMQGGGTGTIGSQVNGGTTSSSPGMGTGSTAQTDMHGCSQGASASAAGSANSGGARGTAASTCGTMQNGTMSGSQSASGTGTGMGTGTGSGTWSGSGTASAGTGTGSGTGMGTGSYTGTGGPYTGARSYPPCTRTRTDSCTQRGRRR
jgi:hypothetical protein